MEPIFRVDTDDALRAVQALSGAPGIVDAAMFGRSLHITVEEEATAGYTVTTVLSAAGRKVFEMARVRPSLEDVFVSLVRSEGGAAALRPSTAF